MRTENSPFGRTPFDLGPNRALVLLVFVCAMVDIENKVRLEQACKAESEIRGIICFATDKDVDTADPNLIESLIPEVNNGLVQRSALEQLKALLTTPANDFIFYNDTDKTAMVCIQPDPSSRILTRFNITLPTGPGAPLALGFDRDIEILKAIRSIQEVPPHSNHPFHIFFSWCGVLYF